MVDLGVQAQGVKRHLDMQRTVTEQVDLARTSASGVNIDEEMTNLVAFQRAYEGAARVLTAIDETLDTLINRTGLVGR
ncbi:MAG TPA: flagellar basal body rod C-terminal domain-containing protein [Mycobacteriales bacterium]|nr:flagellar basal body rod C-terminal domain-containing protein [Mycobacteriales bacterium]